MRWSIGQRKCLTPTTRFVASPAKRAGITALVLFALKRSIGIRVDEESEREGLDIRTHGESVA